MSQLTFLVSEYRATMWLWLRKFLTRIVILVVSLGDDTRSLQKRMGGGAMFVGNPRGCLGVPLPKILQDIGGTP
jgi:hypothetical protein